MPNNPPRPWSGRTGSNRFLIHLIIFNVLLPWNVWTGKALSSKFDFRDDPPTKVGFGFRSPGGVIAMPTNVDVIIFQENIEASLQIIHDISTENIGTMCINKIYNPLKIPLNTERYDGARQKSDLASVILQEMGFNHHSGECDVRKCNWKFRLIQSTNRSPNFFLFVSIRFS